MRAPPGAKGSAPPFASGAGALVAGRQLAVPPSEIRLLHHHVRSAVKKAIAWCVVLLAVAVAGLGLVAVDSETRQHVLWQSEEYTATITRIEVDGRCRSGRRSYGTRKHLTLEWQQDGRSRVDTVTECGGHDQVGDQMQVWVADDDVHTSSPGVWQFGLVAFLAVLGAVGLVVVWGAVRTHLRVRRILAGAPPALVHDVTEVPWGPQVMATPIGSWGRGVRPAPMPPGRVFASGSSGFYPRGLSLHVTPQGARTWVVVGGRNHHNDSGWRGRR